MSRVFSECLQRIVVYSMGTDARIHILAARRIGKETEN
jgi:hypothetical protein